MMTKGWWIYAAVILTMTAIAVGGGDGNSADVLLALVVNAVFLVLLPRLVQLGWQRARKGREA